MIRISNIRKRTLIYLVIIALSSFGGYLAYAQFSADAFTVKTVHIFPAEIEADGWNNAETLTFQNLDEYALLQEFNDINSATLQTSDFTKRRLLNEAEKREEENEQDNLEDESVTEEVILNDVEATASTTEDADDSVATTTDQVDEPEVVFDIPSSTVEVVPEIVTEPQTSTTEVIEPALEEEAESAEVENEPTEESAATTTVMRQVTSLFRLAVETVTSAIESATSTTAEFEDTESEEVAVEEVVEVEEVVVESTESETSSSTQQENEVDQSEEVTDETDEEVLVDPVLELGVSTEENGNEEEAVASSTEQEIDQPEEVVEGSDTESSAEDISTSTDEAVIEDCVDDCHPYVISLNNFAFPLDEGVEITGAQLRMSFAAKKRATRERMPVFEIRYSNDFGTTWNEGGVVLIDEEASNSVNGGYYLFALPTISDQESLNGLQVELVYHDDPGILEDLFVESVWLELFTLEPPEEIEQAPFAELLANDGYSLTPLSGDELQLPDGEVLDFGFTDNNEDETLIIKSTESTYHGVSETETYFSVTNISDKVDDVQIQAYFPDDVGEVRSLEVFNQNKPREAVVTEYRPYVYHCEAGWEYVGNYAPQSLEELSRDLSSENVSVDSASTTEAIIVTEPVFNIASSTSSSSLPELEIGETVTNTTTTVLKRLPGLTQLLQLSTVELLGTTTSETIEETEGLEAEGDEGLVAGYACRNTNVIRECDELDGENTSCRVDQVKVKDHFVTQYAPGWERATFANDSLPEPSFFERAAAFIGFGPDRKEVPDTFEVRAHTPGTYTIQPGETLYFKMDIAFPPFTSGEYWIEAIGDHEYGLLDPFWSSQWIYRLPISIDNTTGTDTLTEHQVFLELDSSLTDFWTNVNDDGSDIRFIQETVVGNLDDWYGTGWGNRFPVTIQASQVDSDLTDFPVYVDLADLGSSFFSSVQSDGADIRITESDGLTELAYELVSIDTGAETGELHFNAANISSAVDTTFYIYHDNPNVSGYAASDPFGADSVWNSDYIAVYHMEEDAAGRGTTGLYQDSTTNNYDADDELNSTGKTGLLGQGQEVDAQGDPGEYILLPSDIVNGENQLTFSYWFNSSETNNQALINGGANNDYLIFMQSGGTAMNLFPGGTPTVDDVSIAPSWRHVLVSRDASANEWRIFIDGVEDNDSPSGSTLSALAIPDDCLVIGLEQDTSCLNSGDTTQHTNGFIDEMRFYNVVPSDAVITATYRNQATTTDFYNVGLADPLQITTFSELDHWVQHFSTSTDEADIWVQVDTIAASASTTIYLYYGNSGATSVSDEFAPFTYSSLQDLYYVVHGDVTQDIAIYSLVDNNQVQVDGGTVIDLDKGETTTVSGYSSTTVISTLGPITSRQTDNEGEPVLPIAFATTTHVIPSERNTEEFHVYSPFGSTTVQVYDQTTLENTSNVGTSSVELITNDISGGSAGIVESTLPVLVYAEGGSNDSIASYPPSLRDLFGFHSQDWFVSTAETSVNYDVYCSGGASSLADSIARGVEGGDGGSGNPCTTGADAGGDAVRITNQTGYLSAIQQADSDGGESTTFLPEMEFGTDYYIPVNVDYVAAICSPRFGTSTIEIYNGGSSVATESFTCTPGAETPGTVRFTQGSGGDDQQYTAGTRVLSTNGVPFYVIYDHTTDDDETNTWSSAQARKYDPIGAGDRAFSVGAQEVNIDAEYNQLSFAWYENLNGETPTSTWSLGDDGNVAEGEVITGQGAVNDGDVLRLRMSLEANVATGTASSTAFALQYAASETCSTASLWYDIGKVGSTTAAFSGYNNTAIDDGQVLTSTLLASSTVFGTYEEASLSAKIQNEIAPDEIAEWDWVITSSNAVVNTNYCFRMVRSSGDVLATYTLYPQLITSGPPEVATLLERFDNEHATSTQPTLEFVASDLSGDNLVYEIQIDDDVNFGSLLIDHDSDTNFTLFENVADVSDKTPFTSGQVIRYTPTISLTSSTTYWWRVRSIDPDGSNTFSDWSDPFSFTINEAQTVSEWFQTTDDQFLTNSLSSATTSGSGSIEADLGGSSTIGEYGSVDVNVDVTGTTTVNLNNTYTNPVVAVSVRYSRSIANGDQPIARVFNKTSTSFDVLASTFDFTSVGTTTVDYMVMEAGEALIDDGGSGLRVFATSTSVGAIEGSAIAGDPTGAVDILFPTAFSSAPTVFAAITTNNDPNFLAPTVYDGNAIGNPPTAAQVSLYLNDSLASNGHGSAEDMDIIVIEPGSGTNDSVNFAAQVTDEDVGDAPTTEPFAATYSSVPGVILVQQRTMNGNQGGYSMVDIDTPPSATNVTLSSEEGGTAGARGHADETLSLISFESSSGDIIRSGNAQVVSTAIDFDDADVGNAWGEFSFNDNGDVTYQIEYQTGSGFVAIPDTDLPGNSTGFTTSPVNILNLDTTTYNEIRLVANLSGASPELFDWTVTWGQRVDIPTLGDPYDNQKVSTTTPTFDFTTTDPQGDALVYELSYSIDNTFVSASSTFRSDVSPDFSAGSPYVSGATAMYTVPPGDALVDGQTYWWRVRAKDPAGGDAFSPWSEPDSFTIDTAIVVSTWFQTTEEQFLEGELDGVTASSTDAIEITTEIGEYGTTTLTNNNWTTINTQLTYNNMVVVATPEYAFDGAGNGRTAQVRNKTNNSFEIKVDNYTESLSGITDVDYVVMEAGDWLISDGGAGTRFLAGTVEEVGTVQGSVPGYNGGTFLDFSPDFVGTPGAITTVSSANGSEWVATVINNGSQTEEIVNTGMFVSLGISLDTNTVRTPEDIDYVVFEAATGTNNGVLFDAFNTGNVVTEGDAESTVNFNQSFSSAPGVIVVMNNADNGGDGGFANVDTDTTLTSTQVGLSIAEMGASAGNHTTEVVSVLAFEGESGTIRRESASTGGLTGTFGSEPVLFTDGLGPKFQQALFATTSPGNSSTSIQIQYQESDGSWSLIPDSQIPGNSTGNTLSPIDLTNVDVSTYQVIRLFGTLQCDDANCPTLEDWTVEWSEGVPISGTIREYDRLTNVTSGTVRVAVNGTLGNTGTIAGDGTWTINNVTAFDGDVVTVWVDGAATDENKAAAIFVYDGIGDMINIELYEQHLSLSADENGTTTNALIGSYDNSVSSDPDIFFDVDANNDLSVCAISGCSEANLYIGPGDVYIPDTANSGNIETHDFINDGTFELDGNTMRVSGSWLNNATIDMADSSLIFTATSTTETIDDADNILDFDTVTFGETPGTATWETADPLDVDGDLSVDFGTLDRASSTINVAGNLTTGSAGFWSGISTTTFDGNMLSIWTDNNTSLQDIGYVVIDGDSKTTFLGSDVQSTNVTIEANDTLNGASAYTLNIMGNFTNTGTFIPQTSTIAVIGTAVDAVITAGGSSLNNLTASSTGGSVSFVENNITLLGDLTIATGTVNLAIATTTIDGSFINTGGNFAHNNAEVRFTSANSETIQLQGTEFLNHFYDVTFTGNGDWIFVDTNATTSNNFSISNGDVTLPAGNLVVARNFNVSGGSFNPNGGEVIFLTRSDDMITTNSSAFNDVRIRLADPIRSGTYPSEWLYRDMITINASQIDDDLVDFPVYLDLSDFSSDFFANLYDDGGDIRITTSDGSTEVPREVVSASTTAETGEVYFRAPSLSSTTDSVFYIYYGNATATDYAIDDEFGAENVWSNGYLAVYHMEAMDPVDSTNNDKDTLAVGDTPTTATGLFGNALSLTDNAGSDYLDLQDNLSELTGLTEMTVSAWVNVTDDGNDDSFFTRELSGNTTPILMWDNIGGSTDNDTYTFNVGNTGVGGNRVDASPTGISAGGTWQFVSGHMESTSRLIYVDGGLSNTSSGADSPIPANTSGAAIGYWSITANFDYDGLIDEWRLSTTSRSASWVSAEYRNMSTSTDFYTVASGASGATRIFSDVTTTINGDLIIESGQTQFPSGTLNVGGSFDNDGIFIAGSGLVNFNSTSSAESIAAGTTSTFYNLAFDDPGGIWSITENATATNNILVASGTSFTVDFDVVLESTGTFTNEMDRANTNWLAGTLRLSSGNDFAINSKLHGGDAYGRITTVGDTDISMWNSTASTYDTLDTSSIYSQNHDDIVGDLYIYGDYGREIGTEYWSYATDFDGADLSGGSERQANVRIANSATVTASSSNIEILGASGASTTVNSQTGTYTLIASNATVTAQYFEMTGTDADGLQLVSSTTVNMLDNAEFAIAGASAAITVDATTIDTTPGAQFFDTDFVSGGGSVNVTLSGSPSSFWWFRDGEGDRYGEAFDNADGNPGSIQWDDSNFQITVAGTVYIDDGVTPIGGPTCDGVTNNVRIVVDGGTYTDAVSCDGITGAYSFSNVSYGGDANIVVYLDTNGGAHGSVITRTPTGDITDMDIYGSQVIVRHENVATLSIADMTEYDSDDDSDIYFTASTSTSPDSLDVVAGSGLYVWNSKQFIPSGEVTLLGGGNYVQDGTLTIGSNATYTSAFANDIVVGGSFFVNSNATFDGASSTVTFTATNTEQQISAAASSTINFYDIAFTGVGGGWAVQTPIISATDILVATGTVSGVSDITITNGEFTGEGLVDMTGGTVTINRANTLGGSNEWAFNNLTLGDTVNPDVTVRASNATTTVRDTFTIATGHFLDAYGSVWDIQGDGNTFVEDGTFIEGTSTVRYSGAAPNVTQTAYNNLVIDAESGGATNAIAPVTGLQVLGDLTIGALGTSTLDVDTNDPLLAVSGDIYIGSLGTLEASDVSDINAFGSWDNDGSFVANGGTVEFLQAASTAIIAAGNSDFANLSTIGNAIFNFTESATTTENFSLAGGGYILDSGNVLAVGGVFNNSMTDSVTTWTGTTLSLYGGNAYTINSKTTSDTYDTIYVSSTTHPRLWNSTTTVINTESGSSLYSMDHEGVDGNLYIFGDFVNNTFDDYWSYDNDFDGATLGTSRLANVLIEAGGSVLYDGGNLSVIGSSTATTTIAAQTVGTFDLTLGGTTTVEMGYYSVRDTTASGTVFTGTPTVTDLSNGDYEVAIADGTAITVGGTVIDVNPAKEFNFVRLATTTAINAFNVTATGTSASAWRFVNVFGNLDGEAKDIDPAGDPGYVTWQDSAAIINITGNVYSDEGVTTSGVCDGVTNNIRLSVNGSTFFNTSCDAGTGAYSFIGINFGLGNVLSVYINDETENAVTVTQDPISSIANFDLYENRVIVKHENTDPINIADLETWDSDDDPGDIMYDAELSGTNILTLDADTKLIVASTKTFEPGGDVVIPGGGSGSAYDGTFELQSGATFTGNDAEEYTIGGSLLSGAGATFDAAQSTTTFTTTGAARTIDTNNGGFYNVTFTGSGSWTVTDTVFDIENDLSKSAGALTLPNGTTTIGGSFTNSGGTFDANSGTLVFTATDSGNDVRFAGSNANIVRFEGTGDWSMSDTNATATDSFIVATGTVTLPSGTLEIGNDFIVTDTVSQNNGVVRLTGTSGGNILTLSGNDLNDVTIVAGGGDYTQTDAAAAFLGDLIIQSGTYTTGTSTLSIGGSFDATAGTFVNNSGTVLFNSSDTGEIVDPGVNEFFNVTFAGAGGGWTIADNATTTNNLTVSTGASFTQAASTVLYVGGVFTNTLGGSATTWTGSTLVLDSGTEYEVNTKVTPTEQYETLIIGDNSDISFWNSAATTTSVSASSSLYSQDNAGVDGDLYVYGDYHIATTTQYWSYDTDFDGTALGGSPRAVNVLIADGSAITVDGATLNIIGAASASTSVTNQGVGTYTFLVESGTFNADYYSFRNLDDVGLQFTGAPAITSLSRGDFEQAANNVELITLASTTLNANASLLITDTRFDSGGFTGGRNVALDATTTNSWNFTGAIGDLWGESFDVDGVDQCSSIRWDDSSCLLTEQTNYRWRNDDGGEGAAPGTWYDSNWSVRKRIRVVNADPSAYTDVAVKLNVVYDADMQSDFDDLRFTDSTGTVLIDHWQERFTTATEADVWVQIPTLATSSVTEIYMYYGNVSATSTSNGSNVFNEFEDFEDNDISDYTGDTSLFATGGTFAFGGSFGLDASPNTSARATDGIARTGSNVAQGEIIRYMQYVDTAAGSGDEVCTMFGVSGGVTANTNYAVCLEQFGTDRVSIVENVENTDSTGTLLASSSITFATGWYEVEIDWQTDNTIDVSVYDDSGVLQATTSASDSSISSGEIGFTFWFQNGGWDSYVSWPRTDTKPVAYFGAEQSDGGASWAADQDTAGSGYAFGQTARLRVGIENTGLQIENQNFRLEYAPKLVAPSCEAVSAASFAEVPVAASCGASPLCMTTSASTTNGDPTTDHLITDAGTFVPGEMVTDPSNQSGNLDVDQNEYIELEYAVNLTVNAVNDAYCFRVTDGGSSLDSYALLPELTLAFDPVLDPVSLNDGLDITLTAGTTTTVIASTTVTDFNGFADLAYATTTFYKTSVGAACTPDNNNCYIASSTACTFTNCSGSTCTLNCAAEFQFHTDPTDIDGGEEWFAFMEVEDSVGGVDFDTSIGVELLTLRALEVLNAIGYGTVDVNENTGTFNPNVTLNNLGNEPIDVQIAGTDMTDGVASIIPAAQQIFATSTFDYAACVSCSALSVTPVSVEVDLNKPTTDSPPVSDEIYWGVEVPFGTASNAHTGVNTFTAISD